MEDDIDIYEDLPNFEPKECQANKELVEECSKLKEENSKLKGDVAKLGANISSLMKTAKAEISRKDRTIAELRQVLDNAAFRRGKFAAWRSQNINNPRTKQSAQNTTREKQTAPPMKEELLQENTATEFDDRSDEDIETPESNDHQRKLTSTVFGARLKKKLMLEEEAARKQKKEASVAVLEIPVKIEEAAHAELDNGNFFVTKEDPDDVSQDTSSALIKSELPDTISLPQSTAGHSQTNQADDKTPYHRRAPKRDLSEERDFSTNPEQKKRRRIEDDRYRREEVARQHLNGNFKCDDVRYNFDGFENNDYSKTSMKNTYSRYMNYRRGDYHRANRHVRGGRSKSMYRSNKNDPRYRSVEGRRPDRHWKDESRNYNDKYDKRREAGWSREGDNDGTECNRKIDNLRDKFDDRVEGRIEYNKHNSHHNNQSGWNLKRVGCKSRSPENRRSHSSGRRSREKEFDKQRSRKSRSTDKTINAMRTVDERESGRVRQSTPAKDSEGFKVKVENSHDAQPEILSDFSKNTLPNEVAIDKITSGEITENVRVDIESAESAVQPLEKLIDRTETSEKHKSHSSKKGSREKDLDMQQSKTSRSADKFTNAMSTVDDRGCVQGHQSARTENSKDFEAEVRNSHDTQTKVPPDFSENYPPTEVVTDKVSSSEIAENGLLLCTEKPGRVDIENEASAGLPLEKLVSQIESSDKHRSHSSRKKSREKESDKQQSKKSRSTDKVVNTMSTVDERESALEHQSMPAKDSKDFKAEVRNSRDDQLEVPFDCSKNSPSNEMAADKISLNEIAEDGALLCTEKSVHFDTENVESTGQPLEKLVSQMEASEKHRSHSSGRRSTEKEFDKRQSKKSTSTDKIINAMCTVDERESGQEHRNTRAEGSEHFEAEVRNSRDTQPTVPSDFLKNDLSNKVAADKISSSEIAENGLLLSKEESDHVDAGPAEPAALPLEKLVNRVETSEKHRSHSIRRSSREKELDKRRSKTSSSTDKFINSMSTVDERESGQKRQNTPDNDSEDFRTEVSKNFDAQPKVLPDLSRTDPSNELTTDKISSSEIAENNLLLSTKGSVHVDIKNAESAEQLVEKLVDRVETSEKRKSHSIKRSSRDKELDNRRSKTSRSTDKMINPMSTLDKEKSGQDRQSTPAKDSEVEVRSSNDSQPEVPPDLSRNDPSNEVTTDKISSEIAENNLLLSTEGSVHVDIKNAESAEQLVEKLVDRVETSEKRRSHSVRRSSRDKELDNRRSKTSRSTDKLINPMSTLDKEKSDQERQSTPAKDSKDAEADVRSSNDAQPKVPPDLSRTDPSNEVTTDKISSSEIAENNLLLSTEGSVHVDIKNAESAVQPVEKLVDRVETSEKRRSHSVRRSSRGKELDNRRSKTSRSADKLINPMSTLDKDKSGQERQSTPAKDSKDSEVEVRSSNDSQPEVPPDLSRNDPSNEVTTDKISSEIAVNNLLLSTEGSVHVDIKNAESAEQPVEKLVDRVETSEKRRSDSIRRSSRDKELDNRRSKTSRSADKLINLSTVVKEKYHQERKSTPVEDSKDFEAEVKNSRDARTEVPPACSRNDPPNEVAIDKVFSSEIAEKVSPSCTDRPVHVDIENAESAEQRVEKLVNRVETLEKRSGHSIRRSSREMELDNRPSKASKSTDKFINSISTVVKEKCDQERQSTPAEDSKDFQAKIKNSRDAQAEVPPACSRNDPSNGAETNKISSSEIAEKGSPRWTERPVHVDMENLQSLENLVSQMETPDVSLAELKNDSEVALIQSTIPEPAVLGSGSFREEKIENIEKFINDYKEKAEACLPIASIETDESENHGNSTSSIVDTLTMDVEESAADQKSDNAPINQPDESKTDVDDVARHTESTISKPGITIAERTSSEQLKTLDEKKISQNPETSKTKLDTAKFLTDKVAVLKLQKYQPRIPCVTTLASYPRRKPSVWTDSQSCSRIVKSRPSTNTEADNKSKKAIKTRRITMEEPILQSVENRTERSDSKVVVVIKRIDSTNFVTSKTDENSKTVLPEGTNAKNESRTREDVGRKVESSENNSASVSSSTSNLPHRQTKTIPELSEKEDAALKLYNAQESAGLPEMRLAGKNVLSAALSADSKPSNRKRALPTEVDSYSTPASRSCKIIVTARRRRTMQLEDSCVATTLVSSVDDVNRNEAVKTVCVNTEGAELPKVVSEPVIKRRKRRKRRSSDK